MTGILEKLSATAAGWKFSVLGSVYTGSGGFVRLSPPAYLALLAGGAVLFAVVALFAWRFLRRLPRGGDRATAHGLFSCFAVCYLALGTYVTLVYPPTTDEPHYLAVSDNILRGRGIELAHEYGKRDFRAFYPGETIDPHVVITDDGRMYSQHTAGLPVLVLPGYAVGGRWGVMATLAVLAGLLASALFLVARRAGAGPGPSTVAAALAGSTVPLLPASTLVFTEVPAALLSAAALLSLGTGWVPAACGAILPWLHPRYALIAAGILALDLHASRRRGAVAGRWALLGLASGGAFLCLYHDAALTAVLNVLTEKYPSRLGELTTGSLAAVSFGNPVRAAFAKLLDRDFGVMPFAPWLLALLPGIALAARSRRFPHRWLFAGAGAYFLATCLFRNWGGSAYPGRTLVPLAPFAVGYLALGAGWALAGGWKRRLFTALVALSLLSSWALTACPVLRYTSGRDWILAKLGGAAAALPPMWFPSFLHDNGPSPWIWAAAFAVLAGLSGALAKAPRR